MFISSGGGSGGGGGATTMDQLTDAIIASVAAGDELQYDAPSSAFRNRPAFMFSPKSRGAVGDARRYYGLSVTSGSAVVTAGSPVFPTPGSPEATFLVNKTVSIDYAGAADATLTTTIVSVDSTTQVTLAANAGQNKYGKCVMRYHGTNDTTALQNTFDQAAAVPNGMGGVLVDALYSTSGNLNIPDDLWLEGTGRWRTGFMLRPSAGAVHVLRTHDFDTWTGQTGTVNANRVAKNFSIHRLYIDGNGRNNATARFGLAIYGADYDIKDIMIFGAKGVGLWVECNMSSNIPAGSGTGQGDPPYLYGTGPGGIHCYIERVMVMHCAEGNTTTTVGYGLGAQIALLGPHDSYLAGFDVYGSSNHCAYGVLIGHRGAGGGVDGYGGSQVTDGHIWGNHLVGIRVASGGTMLSNIQSEGGDVQMQVAGAKIKATDLRLYGVTGTRSDEGLELASGSDFHGEAIKIEDCDTCAVRFGTATKYRLYGKASTDNPTPPALYVGTPDPNSDIDLDGTNGYNRSLRRRNGHTVAAVDIGTLTGWGTGATVAVRSGSNVYRGEATFTAGTTPAASPTAILTFPFSFGAAPFVLVNRSGTIAGGTSGFTADNITASQVRIQYAGTPSAGASYSVQWMIQE